MRSKAIFFGSNQNGDAATKLAGGDSCSFRARRGRPCQIAEPERRQLLLDAAESVFVELGYSSASMDDIAHRAGMSKKTLYRLFETKEALFAAVIGSAIDPDKCPECPLRKRVAAQRSPLEASAKSKEWRDN